MKFNPTRLLLSCLLCMGAVASHAEEFRVGFINTDRIFREANTAKVAQTKLEQEFSKREKELQEMDKTFRALIEKQERDAPSLSDAERLKRQRELTTLESDLRRKQRELQEDLNLRRRDETFAIFERMGKIIRQLAEQRKYDLIVQEAVYINPRIDITDEVIRILNGGK